MLSFFCNRLTEESRFFLIFLAFHLVLHNRALWVGRADGFAAVYDTVFDDHDVSVLKEFFTSPTGEKFLSQSNKLNTHFQNFTSKSDAALKNCKDSTKVSAILLKKIKQLVSILYNEKMAAVYAQAFIGLGSEANVILQGLKKGLLNLSPQILFIP